MTTQQQYHIDIRSDTVTKPTIAMRKAMHQVQYACEDTEEDSMVSRLESLAASIFQKQAALFMPSGVMSNQVAIMTWTNPGDEIITWSGAHIVQLEQGALALLAGVTTRMIDSQTGVLDAKEVQGALKKRLLKSKFGNTSLICLENSLSNGRVWPLDSLKKVRQVADRNQLPIHMDGARVFNAKASLGCRTINQITKYVDSVCFCLSKGLCCPVGSMLVGTKDFIEKARSIRDCLGGKFDNPRIFAAAGIQALCSMVEPLRDDHRIATLLAHALSELPYVELDLSSVESNMIFFKITAPSFSAQNFVKHMAQRGIRMTLPFSGGNTLRIVVHHEIRQAEVNEILSGFTSYLPKSE